MNIKIYLFKNFIKFFNFFKKIDIYIYILILIIKYFN